MCACDGRCLDCSVLTLDNPKATTSRFWCHMAAGQKELCELEVVGRNIKSLHDHAPAVFNDPFNKFAHSIRRGTVESAWFWRNGHASARAIELNAKSDVVCAGRELVTCRITSQNWRLRRNLDNPWSDHGLCSRSETIKEGMASSSSGLLSSDWCPPVTPLIPPPLAYKLQRLGSSGVAPLPPAPIAIFVSNGFTTTATSTNGETRVSRCQTHDTLSLSVTQLVTVRLDAEHVTKHVEMGKSTFPCDPPSPTTSATTAVNCYEQTIRRSRAHLLNDAIDRS